jgi:glycosyltransferase involved in cell wall biosynthesis
MACGLPLVATRVGGMEEMVTPGTDGELIPPRDAVALAGALCRVLGDEAERRRRGAAARARVERDFTPAAHLAHFEAALRGWGIG